MPFPKIRSISGTFVAAPPTRVRFSADMTFAELFKVVEKQFNRDMRYEYADFAKMLERIGATTRAVTQRQRLIHS
ncbi:MAG: hypothetical protein LBF87_07525 [Treponema sp.]|nr:hypothetical protein [Treponema sp.]